MQKMRGLLEMNLIKYCLKYDDSEAGEPDELVLYSDSIPKWKK
jgi:hypothetical protein